MYVTFCIEYLAVAFHLGAAFRWGKLRHRRPDRLLRGVAIKTLGGAIPAGDGAVGAGTVHGITGVFHDGSHLACRAIRARFR
jgi:hypothetical protein